MPRWVAYSGVPLDRGGIDKAPLNPATGRNAKNNLPSTWGTRGAAEKCAQRLRKPGHKPGTGIVLGDLGDSFWLCGVDLDGCLTDGALEPWADSIRARLDSYCEISPSGAGAKTFFLVRDRDVAAIRKDGGINHKTQWKTGDHYGVELHLSHTYFTVTGQEYGADPDLARIGSTGPLRIVPAADLLWLIREAGPAFLRAAGSSGKTRDESGSGALFRLAQKIKAAGGTADDFRDAIPDYPDAQAHVAKDGERAIARAWDRSDPPGGARRSFNDPDVVAALDGLTEEELDLIGVAPDPLNGYAADQDGVIRAFTDRHRGELLFDHHRGAWHRFNGVYWRREDTKLAHHYARKVSTQLADLTPGARTLRTVATWEAVERGARTVREFATTSERWDRDPMLLGTPRGTVDLRTGRLRAARPGDYISKIAAAAPVPLDSFDPDRDCLQWLAFLDFALDGDADAIRFLQQWAGYCLTGDTREQVLLFVYGEGGTGKSTAVNTLSAILKDYAVAVDTSTLTARKHEDHKEEIARLHGPRMAVASETEKGSRWAENRIKKITGQDELTARFMRENSFNFIPQFKLTIIGNNAPSLSDVDSAIRRRFLILPFNRKPRHKDEMLAERLKDEWPGILSWMLRGCLDWQANGLLRPAVVNAATESYFAAQDTFGQWLEDRTEQSPGKSTTTAALFESWQRYALALGEDPGSRIKGFPERMEQRGFRSVKNRGGIRGRGFMGISLLPDERRTDFPDE